MKKTVYSIKYDTDGEKVELPTELEIEVPDYLTDKQDIEDHLSNEISFITGFCHYSFLIKN
jgi:uncharacterized protein YdeI (YjbR/CyaY-like superfamily)